MAKNSYVFDDVNTQRESERLRAIEQVFDPDTQKRLISAGISKGAHCLEVGPGTGSIARWMAERCDPSGTVTAVEINPRFIKDEKSFSLIHEDITEAPLPSDHYDIVHARYVLIHIPDYKKALARIICALKPGGHIVLEEPDFTTAKGVNGTAEEIESVRRVNLAIEHMYRDKGINPAFGTLLPSLAEVQGMTDIRTEMNTPLLRGGEGVAEVMALSAEQLQDRFIATKQASAHDVRAYIKYCRNPQRWSVHYATIGMTARKPT